MGFSRQEYWSGLPCLLQGIFPSQGSNLFLLHLPVLAGRFFTTRATWEAHLSMLLLLLSHVSDSVRPHRRQPTTLPSPWDSPGKNTGVGWHVLLQCMKVKSESEATQSCPTPSDPMDCSLPGSSVHGIFQARVLSRVPLPSPSMLLQMAIFHFFMSNNPLCVYMYTHALTHIHTHTYIANLLYLNSDIFNAKIVNKVQMSHFTTSIRQCSRGPSQCNEERKKKLKGIN